MKHFLYFLLIAVQSLSAQEQWTLQSVLDFQQEMNEKFIAPETSPLKEKDRADFKGLDFYPIQESFVVEAHFKKAKKEKPFPMPTTTSRKPMYIKYGELHFTIEGKKCVLNVYQNLEMTSKEEYKDYLFLPFTDLTSGAGSYGGGRYLDMKIPDGNKILIDFNKAYNPYCAYNERYSCPIPPESNDLPIAIEAGVKQFKK